MQPKENLTSDEADEKLEVVVGVFSSHQEASRVAASLRGPDLQIQKVSRTDPAAPGSMPEIVYDDVEDVDADDVTKGAVMGGAIGAGSGLLLLGVPGLNVAAPIAGLLVGAWIGAVAGVDETIRGIELPGQDDYRRMLAEGESFVVIAGDEAKRTEYGSKLAELGAEDVHQHPPVGHMVRSPNSDDAEQA